MTKDEQRDQMRTSGHEDMNAYIKRKPGMYEVKKGSRVVGRKIVDTWRREIVDANILSVEAGTNGFRGGDSGCCTYVRISDMGGTTMHPRIIDEGFGGAPTIEITLGGDSELETFITALKFIIKVLDREKGVRV